VYKGARLAKTDRDATEFWIGEIREGGFVLDLISDTASDIVSRIVQAFSAEEAFDAGLEDLESSLKASAANRLTGIADRDLRQFADYMARPDPRVIRRYGDRSILKEIDQTLIPIRASDDSTLEYELRTDNGTSQFSFNFQRAQAFHQKISARTLGDPLIVNGRIRRLDRGNRNARPHGIFTSSPSGKDHQLYITNEQDYNNLLPYMHSVDGASPIVSIVACPVLEFGSFEPNGGDLYFLAIR